MNPSDPPLVTDPSWMQTVNPPPARQGILLDVFVPENEESVAIHIQRINQEAAASPTPKTPSSAQAGTAKPYDHPKYCPIPQKGYYAHFRKIHVTLDTPDAFRGSVSFKVREICNYMHRITKLLLNSDEFSNDDHRYVTEMCVCVVQWLKSWYEECRVQVDKWENVWNNFPDLPTFINYKDEYPGLDARTMCLYYRHNLPTAYWQYREEYTVFHEMSLFASEQMWNPYAVKGRLQPDHPRNKVHKPVRNLVDQMDSIRQLFWRRVALMDAVKTNYHSCIDVYRSLPYKFKLRLLKHLEDLSIAEATGAPESPKLRVAISDPSEVPSSSSGPTDRKGKKRAMPPPVKFEEVDYYALDREERKRAERGGPCPGEELSPYHRSFKEEAFKVEYTARKARRQDKAPRAGPSTEARKPEERVQPTAVPPREQDEWVTSWVRDVADAEEIGSSFAENPASNRSLLNRLRFPLIGSASRAGAGEDVSSEQASPPPPQSPAASSAPVASPLRRMTSAPPFSLGDVERAVDEVARSGGSRQRTNLARLFRGGSSSASKKEKEEGGEQAEAHESKDPGVEYDAEGRPLGGGHRKHTI